MSKKEKKMMSTKKCASIFVPLSAFTLAIAIAVPIFSNIFSPTLNTVFGQGELVTEENKNIDTDYYKKKSDTEALEESVNLTAKIAEEGVVLLKNENCLPLSKNDVIAPFGYSYYRSGFTGGSSNWNGAKLETKSLSQSIKESFKVNSTIENLTRSAKVIAVKEAANTSPSVVETIVGNTRTSLYSLAFDSYVGHETDLNGTIGIMAVSRGGGEGADLKMDGFEGGSKHALQLTEDEMKTLRFMKANCKNTILISTSVNIIEINDEVNNLCDVILYMPNPGSAGAGVIGDILSGKVNPSGKTVDTWAKDFLKMPVNENFGFSGTNPYKSGNPYMTYTNVKQLNGSSNGTFVQYEEGIYVGYRWYETAYKEGKINYDEEVAFPFGHGLSYTSFTQEIVDQKVSGNKVTLSVKVTNTGDVAGKDAVQVYFEAPYTEFDKTNGIEKSSKNLITFDKTDTIEKGKSQTIDVSFNIDEMSSYYYKRDNGDGTKGCYFLEKGNYTIHLGKNAHEDFDTWTYNNSKDIFYDNSNPRQSEKDGQSKLDKEGNPTGEAKNGGEFVAATNMFQSSSDFMNEDGITNLSRKDFTATYPTTPTEADRTLKDVYKEEFDSYKSSVMDVRKHPVLGNQKGSKVRDTRPFKIEQKGLVLSSYRGVDYDDESWDDLLNQISFRSKENLNQIGKLLGYGAYNTGALDAINKISTEDFDGPDGFSTFGSKKDWRWCNYSSQTITACTFNPRLAYERGKTMGQEGLSNNVQGLYAPAMNLHRSPFGGRNAEYISEDPVISGVISANIMSGAADGGIYTYMKHFALNEQESNRQQMVMTWANEQTIRELYLKPFEICAKTARQKLYYYNTETKQNEYKVIRGCNGVMTGFNCIGPVMAAQNWSLNTGVLRNEWGFEGMVITDYGPKVERDQMIRSGNDFYLTAFSGIKGQSMTDIFKDSSSITSLHVIRKAIKNICYTLVNSGTYNGIAPNAKSYRKMATWEIWINYVLTISMYALTAGFLSIVAVNYVQNRKKKQVLATTNAVAEDTNINIIPPIEEEQEPNKMILIRKPFSDKIEAASNEVKNYYNTLKELLLSYGLSSRISMSGETFKYNKQELAKITIVGKTLCLHLALNPEDYQGSTVNVKNDSGKKTYQSMPTLIKIKSLLAFKRAKMLIIDLMQMNQIKKVD